MELLHMTKEPLHMTLPLLPPAAVAGGPGKPAPLKASSLSRLEDLQQLLRQCDEPGYLRSYVKAFSTMPRNLLEDLTHKIKARCAFLCAEEQREYKRAKLLNVMGTPCDGRGSGESGALGGSAGLAAADADFFCSQVLEGVGGEDAAPPAAVVDGFLAGEELQLEQLDMQAEQQQLFLTPADAARMRGGAPQLAQQAAAVPGSGGVAAGAQPGTAGQEGTPSDVSPADPAAGGALTDHQISRISPGDQPAVPPAEQQQQAAAAARSGGASGGARVRQTTLLPDK